MQLIPLTTPPTQIYILPYQHNGTPLTLACAPDGGLLRSQFVQDQPIAAAANRLTEACYKQWPQAIIQPAPDGFRPDLTRAYLYGTAFQQAVWQELAILAPGMIISYGQLAIRIGQPGASRAVGNAVGANPYAPFIACHRVLAGNRKIGGFIGGPDLKRQLLQAEGISL